MTSIENISRNGPRNCRSLGYPGFPVKVGDVANSMRFSLQKTAHAALSSAANRKSGYARDDKGKATLPWRAVTGQNSSSNLFKQKSQLSPLSSRAKPRDLQFHSTSK